MTTVCVQRSTCVCVESENPAEYNQDDRAIANQVAETMLAAFASGDCEVFIDTYVDVDRGYFPRHGLFDRRYNPRPASFVYRYLQGWLGALDEAPVLGAIVHVDGGRVGSFGAGNSSACLLLPDADTNALLELPAGVLPEGSGDASLIDLCSGNIVAVRATAAGDGSLQLDPSAAVKSPSLVIAGRGWA